MTQRLAASVDVGLHRVTPLTVTAPLPRLVGQLNANRPQALDAYPSIAALLGEEQLAGRLRLGLRALSTSSEALLPEVRKRLERAFGCDRSTSTGRRRASGAATAPSGRAFTCSRTCASSRTSTRTAARSPLASPARGCSRRGERRRPAPASRHRRAPTRGGSSGARDRGRGGRAPRAHRRRKVAARRPRPGRPQYRIE